MKPDETETVDELKEASVSAAVSAAVAVAELEDRTTSSDSWETDSLFEDIIDELTDENAAHSGRPEDCCSPEEASRLRSELRQHGPAVFCQRTVDAGRYTAKKLLSAFAIRAPSFLQGCPDSAYFGLLSLAISRELAKRAKLPQHNSLDDAVALIRQSSHIIVITGAGISTSLGIPDFRSKDIGLYARLGHLGLSDPQEVFDIALFKEDPAVFYSVAKDIIPSSDRYTPTHRFLAMLHERGKLLTNYSQNIDNLEAKAGLPAEKLIHCHGSFGTATCVTCGFCVPGETIFPDIKADKIPRCARCLEAASTPKPKPKPKPTSSKRKRPANSSSDRRRRRGSYPDSASSENEDEDEAEDEDPAQASAGVMKPDIVFFGESLPDAFSDRLTQHDRPKVDLVLVMGTSLKVTPVSEMVGYLPPHVPQIYISREPVTHVNFDIDLLGDCDVVVAELCRRLGWEMVHEMVPEGQEVEVVTEGSMKSRHVLKVR